MAEISIREGQGEISIREGQGEEDAVAPSNCRGHGLLYPLPHGQPPLEAGSKRGLPTCISQIDDRSVSSFDSIKCPPV